MRILTAEQIKNAENKAIEKYFSESELMKRAGVRCTEKIIKYYGKIINGNKVSVICGNGKNAGDGFVIANELCKFGAKAEIVLADKMPVISEPLLYFNEAVRNKVKVIDFRDAELNGKLIVDCIFGIGFHGAPNQQFSDIFSLINNSGIPIISIDTPSGTNASVGCVENAVKADLTIAVSTLKYCHILPPANGYCGKTVVVNIGIPDDCYVEEYIYSITKSFVKSCFKPAEKNSNKGTNGTLTNICGSYRMPGAAVLCAKAALKTGVGLLRCVFPKSTYYLIASHLIQPIFLPVSENENKTFSIGALNDIIDAVKSSDSAAVGCGMGCNDDTRVIVSQIIKESVSPVIIDADGINSLVGNIDVLRDAHSRIVLTPHPGEMARLIGKSVSFVQQNRIETAKNFAKEFGVITVLKGANTVVTNGDEVFVNTTGNPGMAMGGTGDMLTGMIGSLAAQGMELFSAAKCAVYIHGLCGDITANEISQRGMTADDMLELLGALMSEFD
ncbi:MAG: NAD(P)H-hydrate dehydratase [Clostridiales bacterium]|nr:NAD(P)H-hydrate dehydratase [Clostridiales bacterium]